MHTQPHYDRRLLAICTLILSAVSDQQRVNMLALYHRCPSYQWRDLQVNVIRYGSSVIAYNVTTRYLVSEQDE